MKQILLVEDDPQICEVIETYFRHKQTEICSVHNGSDAMQIVRCSLSAYELVLLDVMLPETDGFTICREIRRRADLPVIFLTARGREEDVLYGYDMGCDDYIVKPFLLSALYAKCMALLRRSDGTVINDLLVCGDIRLNVRMLSCFASDREIELPPKEFAILHYLMTHEDWTVRTAFRLERTGQRIPVRGRSALRHLRIGHLSACHIRKSDRSSDRPQHDRPLHVRDSNIG